MYQTYFIYIIKNYTKSLFLILVGISCAITLIDYLQHATRIANSGNQLVLYVFYTWQFRLAQFYPLAMVFAGIVTYMSLVQSHTLVSLFSFGYSKRKLFVPFILPAVLVYLILIVLQGGAFSYARERAWSISHHMPSARKVDNLFFKYNHTFVYVKELDPIKKILKDVTVFELNNKIVQRAVTLPMAHFDGEYWVASSAWVTEKKYSENGVLEGFGRQKVNGYKLLRGYKPKVIELIYEGESLSLWDAIHTYSVLKTQGLSTDKIKASFYNKVLLPLFAFVVMTILFFKAPHYARYMNKERLWALALGGTLVIWGILYTLFSLSMSGSLSPDIALGMPIAFLVLYAVYLYINGGEKLT
jgi:lipopolysaccharide export system permease protein